MPLTGTQPDQKGSHHNLLRAAAKSIERQDVEQYVRCGEANHHAAAQIFPGRFGTGISPADSSLEIKMKTATYALDIAIGPGHH